MGKTAKADYSSAAAKLLRAVQARQMEKKKKKEKTKEENDGKSSCILDLPKDCIYRSLIKLDVESLQRAKFVGKSWYKMISNTIFVEDRLRRSEMGLIFLYKSSEKETTSSDENVFHVEQHYLSRKTGINWMPRIDQYEPELNLRFMEIKDGKSTVRSLKLSTYGKIRAVCNGLVLLESKTKCGPIVINPVTREYTVLCRGTETLPRFESYGLAFSHRTEEYKVVHLFRDDLQFFGCEIMVVGSRTWRPVDGPSSGLIYELGKAPVVTIGAFHWMPHILNSDYIVSMGIDDEKFRKIKLPETSGRFDGLVNMGESLSFVHQASQLQLDVWILEDLHGSKWTLKHKITVGSTICMVPVGYNPRNNELVLKKGQALGTYDFRQRQMKWIEMNEGFSPYMGSYMPHFNSLVTWRNRRGEQLEDV